MKIPKLISMMILGTALTSAHATRFGYLTLSPSGGSILLYWTPTLSSTGSGGAGQYTRTVNEGPGGTPITVNDIEGTCTLNGSTTNGTATLSLLFELVVITPATHGATAPNSTSEVDYQLDWTQDCDSFAYCMRTTGAITTSATQALTSSTASESGFNFVPNSNNPAAVNSFISGSAAIPTTWTLVGSNWVSDYMSIKTTTDSVSRTYTGTPNSDLFGGSNTKTIVNFNQTGGFGVNYLIINY